MKINKTNSPILITGIERSGGTMIAKIINHCGAFAGQTSERMENIKIRSLVKEYYSNLDNVDTTGQYPLPETKKLYISHNWKDMVLESMIEDLYKPNTDWLYKSPRLCQIWPIWNNAFPNAKWIIVRRRTGDVIQSCLKTGFMKAFSLTENQEAVNALSEEEGWLWWIHQHEAYFVEMIEAGLNCKIIWPERMCYGDYQQIYEMLDWLGLKWDDSIIELASSLLKINQEQTV